MALALLCSCGQSESVTPSGAGIDGASGGAGQSAESDGIAGMDGAGVTPIAVEPSSVCDTRGEDVVGSEALGGLAGITAPGGATEAAEPSATPSSNPWLTFDPANVVARSNVALGAPNALRTQFMPLGNGTLGAAVWAEGGFTAQLNRGDTWPDRRSPGKLTIPGLARLTEAADFHGTLELYNGVLMQSGGGMTACIYVRADIDQLVVDVTGADPASTQTATLNLWAPRATQAQVSGTIGILSESWLDSTALGGSGLRFGSLAALTAGGRNVQVATNDPLSVTVSFQPNEDGSFRVIVGSPRFDGSGDAAALASTLLANAASVASADLERGHLTWWHDYWSRIALVKMRSSDGSAEYMENLRAIYLYASAGQSRGPLPGSQAGVANLFNMNQDTQDWFPAGFWFWNLRMQVAANLSAGAFEMNAPLYNLYLSNLANMQAWTRERMGDRPGICVPETMRFNGNGFYAYNNNQSCDQTIAPTYNSLTISTGAEVGLSVWRHYLMTDDRAFLQTNYPLMSEAARFLLAYATEGADGLLHTRSNAHEHQWNVADPITDLAAMHALFPAVIEAAQTLDVDAALVSELGAAIPKLPQLPRWNTARTALLTPADDAAGTTILGWSSEPAAARHNAENLELEPVWPFGLIGDASPLTDLARRSYLQRAYKSSPIWSNDAIHAARLGLADEVAAALNAVTERYQVYPAGFAAGNPNTLTQPFIEQVGVVVTAINEALATDYDGLLRIAPAWPADWSVSGTVFIHGSSKVHVQFDNGAPVFAVLEAGATRTVTLRNPWSGQAVTVIDDAGQPVVAPTAEATLQIEAQQGRAYLVKRGSDPLPEPLLVTGVAATDAKVRGTRTIGIVGN
jgi:hypothetical protein